MNGTGPHFCAPRTARTDWAYSWLPLTAKVSQDCVPFS